MTPKQTKEPKIRLKSIALVLTPILAILFVIFFDLSPGNRGITYTAAIALLMAVWWMTEAIPLAATALIPLVLFPAFGVMDGKVASAQYINHIIFVFIGGFLVALAMERWNLHKRLALKVLMLVGGGPRFILLGFMGATAFLSMWISNTATTMMMVPIGLAVVGQLEDTMGVEKIKTFSVGLFLGIAYGASFGGIATLIGTPPNLALVRMFSLNFPDAPEITFAQWFFFAFPITLVFLFLAWVLLCFLFCRSDLDRLDRDFFSDQYRALGPVSLEEKVVLVDFVLLVLLWMFRADIIVGDFTLPGWAGLLPNAAYINDGTVSVAMALLLFLIPARKSSGGGRVLTWETARRLPWNIVLLFGGGFALAKGFEVSQFSAWLGERLQGLGTLPPLLVVAGVCICLTFLTELTSNTATAQIFLPIMAVLAVSLRLNPLLLMIPAALSCSFAFMLPVATPPNAIVFGTQRLRIADMAWVGLILNLLGTLIITAAIFLIGRGMFGIDPSVMPGWVK